MENNSVCIIGARKGSKRLLDKNKLKINKEPLFLNALNAAKKSNIYKNIIFTTDDIDILDDLRRQKNIIIDERLPSLANSKANMWEVVNHLIEKHTDVFSNADSFSIITPCHPFRNPQNIIEAFNTFKESNGDYLMSVSELPCPPELTFEIENNQIKKTFTGLVRKGEYKTRYYPNGAISFIDLSFYLKNNDLYSGRTIPFLMDWVDGLDIDYEKDYLLAKKIEGIL